MASCDDDDDFPLYGDDHHHHHHHHNHHTNPSLPHPQHHQPYAPPRFTTKATQPILAPSSTAGNAGSPKRIVAGEEGEYDEAAFYNQTDPKGGSAFPHVNPFSAEDGSNAFDDENDRTRPMVDGQSDKRKDREELSDGGTTYSFKKLKPSGGECRKDREEWSDAAISCLLDAYNGKFTQLNRGNLRGRDWEEVAVTVSQRCDKQTKSVEQCKNKVDNLKKRYKLERHRMSNGGITVSPWPWFKKMEEIVGNLSPTKVAPDEDKAAGAWNNAPKQSKRYAMATPNPAGHMNSMKSKSMSSPKWRRVVFKISGAAIVGTGPNNIDPKVVMLIAREVAIACRHGVEVAIVVGGRNFFCGDSWVTATGLDRCTAYQIGMMATVMNSILLHSALEKMGVQTRVQTSSAMQEVAEPYSRQRAIRHLEKGRVVIFGGIGAGSGNPLFSTDTAAALRASEIHAEAVLKGTNVDGVYDCNSSNNNATFEHISFRELVSTGAPSMDTTAMTFCKENGIPVVVFNLLEPGNISRALCGEQVGTLIDQTGGIS